MQHFSINLFLWKTFCKSANLFQPPYHAIEKNRPGRVAKNQRDSNKSPRFLDSQPSEWTNIIPQIPNTSNKSPYDYQMIGNSFSYTGNFVFFGLTPSTEYEVIIQSRNREGWSDATDIFRFNTRSQGNSFKEIVCIIVDRFEYDKQIRRHCRYKTFHSL